MTGKKKVTFYNGDGKGTFDVKSNDKREIFGYLYSKNGIRVFDLKTNEHKILNTSDNGISMMKINDQITRLVTVCDKGQNIRIWDIEKYPFKEEPILNLFRGEKHAQIYSLSFNGDSTLLAVTSSSGTLHIFDLENSKNQGSYMKS